MRSQSFIITGMTCANCVNTVSKTLNQSDKIMEATVNLATEKAKIVADDNISDQEIINLVEKRVMEPLLMTKLIRKKLHVKLQKSKKFGFVFLDCFNFDFTFSSCNVC